MKVSYSNELPSMDDVRYNIYMGGLPDSLERVSGSVASEAPYIGCVRDVLVQEKITDFNGVPFHTGLELGICKSELPDGAGDN